MCYGSVGRCQRPKFVQVKSYPEVSAHLMFLDEFCGVRIRHRQWQADARSYGDLDLQVGNRQVGFFPWYVLVLLQSFVAPAQGESCLALVTFISKERASAEVLLQAQRGSEVSKRLFVL